MFEFSHMVGKRIRELRREHGVSALQLSEFVGVSQHQLLRYERGDNRLSVDTLYILCLIFKCTVSEFFNGIIDINHYCDK